MCAVARNRATNLAPLPEGTLEPVARELGEAATGAQVTRLLEQVGLDDPFGSQGTKWKRIHAAIERDQRSTGRANRALAFVKAVLTPARFVGENDRFERHREAINTVLAFAGYFVTEEGRMAERAAVTTIPEAHARASRLRGRLQERGVHPDVLRFCRDELVVPNYFHAVFEATKSVAEKLRSMSGCTTDGSELVDEALALGRTGTPRLAFNTLATGTERSEHNGLANLIKGMFGTFRNVTAHAPKVTWSIDEADALDLLTLTSFIHRRLDRAVPTTRP